MVSQSENTLGNSKVTNTNRRGDFTHTYANQNKYLGNEKGQLQSVLFTSLASCAHKEPKPQLYHQVPNGS